MSRNDKQYRVVYSTETGTICPDCHKATKQCVCAERKRTAVLGDGNVRVRRETKGRAGKTVTTLSGLALNGDQLKELLSDLKRICGAGGAVKDGVIEIQGDRCDQVMDHLAKQGVKAKRAGG